MPHPDFVIAGAGIIGLSLALELDRRGASVVVLEAGKALRQTSFAAAGMLAVEDPANPPALTPFAQLSASLYPTFLDRLAELSGTSIPFQTASTLEACEPHEACPALSNPNDLVPTLSTQAHTFRLLDEHSVDPRQLGQVIRAALPATRIDLREDTALTRLATGSHSVRIHTAAASFETQTLIDCMGTWSPVPVQPRKGQMLAVKLPDGLDLTTVIRTRDIYIVPRTEGPNAGRAILGATIEDAGFDLTVHPADIRALNARASQLLPALAHAEFLDSWAGLRPSTPDGLPILGANPTQPRYIVATGHFRNGILLAPATAHLLAQLLFQEPLELDLTPFTPTRFSRR